RISAVKCGPVCCRFCCWRKSHLGPCSGQRNQKDAVHHAFQVCGEPHAHIREALFEQAGNQPEQEQEHAMPHQTSVHCRATHPSYFLSGIVRGLSLESTTKTANRLAGLLSLAFSLIL